MMATVVARIHEALQIMEPTEYVRWVDFKQNLDTIWAELQSLKRAVDTTVLSTKAPSPEEQPSCPHGWQRLRGVPSPDEYQWCKWHKQDEPLDARCFKDGEYAPCGCFLHETGVISRGDE